MLAPCVCHLLLSIHYYFCDPHCHVLRSHTPNAFLVGLCRHHTVSGGGGEGVKIKGVCGARCGTPHACTLLPQGSQKQNLVFYSSANRRGEFRVEIHEQRKFSGGENSGTPESWCQLRGTSVHPKLGDECMENQQPQKKEQGLRSVLHIVEGTNTGKGCDEGPVFSGPHSSPHCE